MTDHEAQSKLPLEIERKFRSLFRNRPALGAWADIPSLVTAEILAQSGVDFLLIDLEHGPAAEETALAQVLAAERWGAAPIIRVAEARDPWIKKALDLGAAGIMAPAVHTPELARTAALASRYGPEGRRGVATRIVRAARYGADGDYESRWNENAFLIAQIESPEGLENTAEIAATPGVDAVFFGPADYASAAGYPGAAAVKEAFLRFIARGRGAGVLIGATPFADLSAGHLIEAGVDFATIASDVSLLRKGADAALNTARSVPSKP